MSDEKPLEARAFKLVYPFIPWADKEPFALAYCFGDEKQIKELMERHGFSLLVDHDNNQITLLRNGVIQDTRL